MMSKGDCKICCCTMSTDSNNPLHQRNGHPTSPRVHHHHHHKYIFDRHMSTQWLLRCLLATCIAFQCVARGHSVALMDDIYNITSSEYQALVDIYNTTAGWNWVWYNGVGIPWNFTVLDNPCLDMWQGITCTESPEDGYLHIIELDLSEHNLQGYVPESIGNLIYLQSLTLSENGLYGGTIPDSIGRLVQLTALQLHETYIGGTIPNSFGNLTELVTLDLGNNNLFGTIPLNLCSLVQLTDLDIGTNYLIGTIPDCLGSLHRLLYLIVCINQLVGPIPSSLGNLVNLVQLELYNNFLTGSIPDELSALTSLTEFDISKNQITGTIPSWIGNMVDLISLGTYSNLMNGTIPSEIGNLHQLVALYIEFNDYTGTLPLSMGNLVNMEYLDIEENRLSGPCPPYLGNFTGLLFLTLSNNYLTGTFPADIGRAVNLVGVNIGTNLIEGPLPNDLWNCSNLIAFVVSNNQFTHAVPESLLYLPVLHVIELGLNHLSGQLPEAPIGSSGTFFSVGYNHLSGTIPASFRNIEQLVYLNLSYNYLTGTMPADITSLNFLYLTSNLLTGPLPPQWDTVPALSYVFMSENLFSGSIPKAIGSAKVLISLNLSCNHLTGSIPVELSTLHLLEVLLLQENSLTGNINGVLNSGYQHNLTTVQFSNNQLTGTLPDQLFLSKTLTVFAAVSNCFTGSIPLSICNSTSINTLALDGLQSATSCRRALFPTSLNGIVAKGLYTIADPLSDGVPDCLFQMANLTTLHLSGNGLSGELPSDLTITPTLTDLSLSHNKLEGHIPSEFLSHNWINLDLSYNRFSSSLNTNDTVAYSENASLALELNRLSGQVPKAINEVRSISVLEGNLFACNMRESDIPSHDPSIDKYQCGSDTLNETLYAWVATACFVTVAAALSWRWREKVEERIKIRLELLNVWWHSVGAMPELSNYTQFNAVIDVIIRVSVMCTMWCICILMPIYIAMSFAYGTYTHQYAWTLSAAYLSGTVPFALEFTFLILLVAVGYVIFGMYCATVDTNATVSSTRSESVPTVSAGRRFIVYALYLLLTFVIVLGVNVAYVVIALNKNGNALTAAQFTLALFKVGFNSLCSPLLLRWVSRNLLMDSDGWDFVFMQLIVGLINNIAIPCFVVAIISPICFYNIFEAAEPVASAYSYYGKCLTYNINSIVVVTCQEAEVVHATTSYDPPFEYSYQCSSSFITYYAPAYVIMCILAGVAIPVVQIALQALHARATPGTRWFNVLDIVLPRILKPVPSSLAASPRDPLVLYLDAGQHLVTLLTYLGLLLTFGAVFPPLAICFLVTLCCIVVFTRLKVGRFLQVQNKGTVQIINGACVGADNVVNLRRAVLTVLVFSSIFYTLFLFDTLGDSVGFSRAYWVLIVVPLAPIGFFCMAEALVMKHAPAESIVLREPETTGHLELHSLEDGAVQNPIVN